MSVTEHPKLPTSTVYHCPAYLDGNCYFYSLDPEGVYEHLRTLDIYGHKD